MPVEALNNAFIFQNTEDMLRAIANEVADQFNTAVAKRGICHFVFPGGRLQSPLFANLCSLDLPWPSLHFYPSDERCVPVDHVERNDRVIQEILLRQVPLLPENVHSIPAELGPEEGAKIYRRFLERVPRFDVIVLGVGADGHVASLFPHHEVLTDERSVVPVIGSPKPPPERISMGLSRLLGSRHRIVAISGAEKKDLPQRIRHGELLPVSMVQPTQWYIAP